MTEAHMSQREPDAPREPRVLELLERVASHLITREDRQDATIRDIQDRVQRFAAEPSARGRVPRTSAPSSEDWSPWDQESADALAEVYWGETPQAAARRRSSAAATDVSQHILGSLDGIATRLESRLAAIDPSPALADVARRLDALASAATDPTRQANDAAVVASLTAIDADIAALTGAVDRIGAKAERLKDVEQAVGGLADLIDRNASTVAQQIARSTSELGQKLETRLDKPVRPPLGDDDIQRMARAVAHLVATEVSGVRQVALSPDTIAEVARGIAADVVRSLPKAENPKFSDEDLKRVTESIGRALVQKTVATIQSTPRGDDKSVGELKQLIETSVRDDRQADEQVSAMLETLQQAMIGLLDRLDVIERQTAQVAGLAAKPAAIPPAPAAAAGAPILPTLSESIPEFRSPPPAPPPSPPTLPAVAKEQTAAPASIAPAPGSAGLQGPPPPPPPSAAPRTAEPQGDLAPLGGERSKEDLIAAARRAASQAAAQQQQQPAKSAKDKAKKTKAKPAGASGSLLDRRLLIAILAVVATASAYMAFMRKPSRPAVEPPAVQRPAQPAPQPQKSGALDGQRSVDLADAASADTTIEVIQLPVAAGSSGAIVQSSRQISPLEMLRQQEQQGLARLLTPRAEPASAVVPAAADTAQTGERLSAPSSIGPVSLRTAAQDGDPSAEFAVASRLGEGRGVSQDLEQAAAWYQRSAQRGFALSQYRLGTYYERGLGVPKDLARAQAWYRRAAEQGNVRAMHNLAVLMTSRETGAPDYATAATWFSKAAEFGLRDSLFNLAVLHESGLGVEQDNAKAYRYLALAARAGDAQAVKRLGSLRGRLPAAEATRIDEVVAAWRAQVPDRLANDPIAAGDAWRQSETSSG